MAITKMLALGLVLLANVTCISPTSSDSKVSHVAISSVDWVIANIGGAFWSTPSTEMISNKFA